MNKRALVLEMNSSHITLLSEEGEFIRLSQRRLPQARYVGQNISMSQIKPRSKVAWVPLLAACIFLFLVVIPLVFPPPVMAWVSLDNSSSLEVLVDGKFNIREIRPLNNSAGVFLEEYQGGSLEFPILVDEFINWSRQNGDNSLLVTATDDIQTVSSCINNLSDEVQVVSMKVDAEIRDEAGKKGLSAGRAIFMAEARSWESISLEKMQEGNPIETIDSAGVDLDSFVRGLDSDDHAAKIKELPAYNQGPEDEGQDPSEKSGKGQELPPGLAKKDDDHPALRSISRSGSWGNNKGQKPGTGNPDDSEDRSSGDPKEKENKDKDKNKNYKGNKGNNGNKDNNGNNGNGNKGNKGNNGNGNKDNNGNNGKDNKGNNGNKDNNGNNGRGNNGKPDKFKGRNKGHSKGRP